MSASYVPETGSPMPSIQISFSAPAVATKGLSEGAPVPSCSDFQMKRNSTGHTHGVDAKNFTTGVVQSLCHTPRASVTHANVQHRLVVVICPDCSVRAMLLAAKREQRCRHRWFVTRT